MSPENLWLRAVVTYTTVFVATLLNVVTLMAVRRKGRGGAKSGAKNRQRIAPPARLMYLKENVKRASHTAGNDFFPAFQVPSKQCLFKISWATTPPARPVA